MADKTITSTNGVLTLTATSVFPAPVRIEGFATDKSWDIEAQELAETRMGVDGKMSAGFIPTITVQTITLQADSNGHAFFAAVAAAMKTAREILYLGEVLALPSIGEGFTFVRGVLQNIQHVPSGGKVLEPRTYTIHWESVNPALL